MDKVAGDTALSPPAVPQPEDPLPSTGIANDLEEGGEAYRPGGFHPVYIGDVYHAKYEVLSKLGYGRYSTVWLVRDLEAQEGDPGEFYALKVLSAECYGSEKDIFEREILRHLREGDQKLLGYSHICRLVDDFEHTGPNGNHVCLVFELYGETLRGFGAWFPESMIPGQVMRRITIQLLLALDYAHYLNVIHTGKSLSVFPQTLSISKPNLFHYAPDIQPNNIFVKVRSYELIRSGYLSMPPIHQDKDEKQYTVVPSRPMYRYYFEDGDRFDLFDFVLGDWGVSSWADKHLTELIQPVALRAPEVLIGAPWGPAADVWNLGAAVLEMFRALRMFSGFNGGSYEVEQHLAEIVHLLGPFPADLLEKGDQDLVGRVFDDQGNVKGRTPFVDRPDLTHEEFTPGLAQEERVEFVAFLRSAMTIDPAKRPSPEDLLRGPWLRALR